MFAKCRPTFLSLLVLLSTLTMPGCTFGQKTAEDFVNRGNAKKAKGDLDGAIADYSKAIERIPEYANAYYNRGNAKKARGDQVGADADFAQAAKLKGR